MIRQILSEKGTPDTLYLEDPSDSSKRKGYSYSGNGVYCFGLQLNLNSEDKIILNIFQENKKFVFKTYINGEVSSKVEEVLHKLETINEVYKDELHRIYGHNGLVFILEKSGISIPYNYRFRIWYLNDQFHFTCWGSDYDKLFVDRVLETSNIADKKQDVVIHTYDKEGNYNEWFSEETDDELSSSNDKKSSNQIKNRFKEVSSEIVQLKGDLHSKGATLSNHQKYNLKLKIQNLTIEYNALKLALDSGETDIQKVVFDTIDKLDHGDGIPKDILYRELEKKLSKYGRSSVEILQKLRDMKVDIRKVLKEISKKRGNKLTINNFLNELKKYLT